VVERVETKDLLPKMREKRRLLRNKQKDHGFERTVTFICDRMLETRNNLKKKQQNPRIKSGGKQRGDRGGGNLAIKLGQRRASNDVGRTTEKKKKLR